MNSSRIQHYHIYTNSIFYLVIITIFGGIQAASTHSSASVFSTQTTTLEMPEPDSRYAGTTGPLGGLGVIWYAPFFSGGMS
jgi:hypothetical protein